MTARRFNCSKCGRDLEAPPSMEGKRVVCPTCRATTRVAVEGEQTKRCPFCAEVVRVDARKCRFCGEWLERRPTTSISRGSASSRVRASQHNKYWLVAFLIFLTVAVGGLITWKTGLLSKAGVVSETVEIRRVVANPERYAGKTLQSPAVVRAPRVYSDPTSTGKGMPLVLRAEGAV